MSGRAIGLGALVLTLLLGALPTSAGAGPEPDPRPDLVVIYVDDQAWIGGFDAQVGTQALFDQGARLDTGIIANGPVCCPSRVGMLTGTYAHTNGVYGNQGPHGGYGAFDPTSTIATWLSDAGYQTSLVGKYLNGYYEETGGTIVPPGWDTWRALGLTGYEADLGSPWNYSEDGQLMQPPADQYQVDWTGSTSAEFIAGSSIDQPLLLVSAPYAPHYPTIPRPEDKNVFVGARLRSPAVNEADVSDKPRWIQRLEITRAEQTKIDRRFHHAMEVSLALDDMVSTINQALIDRGRPAVVVYMSDNGYLWGEHRYTGKNVPYDAAVRVPAGMWSLNGEPSVTPGIVVSQPVSNIDIAATFAELADVAPPSPVDGQSLLALLDDPGAGTELPRSRILIEHMEGGPVPAYCAVREESWLFVRYRTGEEEAYNYEADPYELDNVATAPRAHDKVRALRRWTRRRCSPLPPGFVQW